MKVSAQIGIVILAGLLLAACGNKGSDAKGTPAPSSDVTSDFVKVTGGKTLNVPSSRGGTTYIQVGRGERGIGTLKILHRGDCSYWVTSQIDYVKRFDDRHFKIRYTDLKIRPTKDSVERNGCRSEIMELERNASGKAHEALFCGYSEDGLDLTSCSGASKHLGH